MNKIENYQLEEFVQDLFFRKWVLGKCPPENQFWENWLKAHPEKDSLIEEAKSLVIASQIEEVEIFEQKIQEGIETIMLLTKPKSKKLYRQTWLKIAASITLAVLFFGVYTHSDFLKNNAFSKTTETENNGLQPLSLKLSDGSTVILKKGSRLQISDDFSV